MWKPFALLLLTACAPLAGVGSDGAGPPRAEGGAGGADPITVGDRLLDAGEAGPALDAYLRAAGRDGLTRPIRQRMAAANIGLRRLGQAESLLRDLLDEDPADPGSWNDLGVILAERGSDAEAYEAFRRAFALDPADVTIRENFRRAASRREAGGYDEAGEAATLSRRRDGSYGLSVRQ